MSREFQLIQHIREAAKELQAARDADDMDAIEELEDELFELEEELNDLQQFEYEDRHNPHGWG